MRYFIFISPIYKIKTIKYNKKSFHNFKLLHCYYTSQLILFFPQFPNPHNLIHFHNIYTNSIWFFFLNKNYIKNLKIILKNFQQFFFLLNYWFFIKLFYKGKGYKIKKYKNKNLLIFSFGACHKQLIYYKGIRLKSKRKRYYSFLYKHTCFLKWNLKKIYQIKPLNLYTHRGLRFTHLVTYQKPKTKTTFM